MIDDSIRQQILKDFGQNPAVNMGIHSKPCQYCPSSQGLDPESQDILKLPIELRKLFVFPCAWRTEKLCRGFCENMELI